MSLPSTYLCPVVDFSREPVWIGGSHPTAGYRNSRQTIASENLWAHFLQRPEKTSFVQHRHKPRAPALEEEKPAIAYATTRSTDLQSKIEVEVECRQAAIKPAGVHPPPRLEIQRSCLCKNAHCGSLEIKDHLRSPPLARQATDESQLNRLVAAHQTAVTAHVAAVAVCCLQREEPPVSQCTRPELSCLQREPSCPQHAQ